MSQKCALLYNREEDWLLYMLLSVLPLIVEVLLVAQSRPTTTHQTAMFELWGQHMLVDCNKVIFLTITVILSFSL